LNEDDISALYGDSVMWGNFTDLIGDVDVCWDGVAATVLDSRPPGGYADAAALEAAITAAVEAEGYKPFLDAMNAALVPDDVLEALEGFYDEDAWGDLQDLGEQGLVVMATAILNNRPEAGYANIDAFTIALNAAVLVAMGEPLAPANFVSTLSGLTAGTYIYTLTGNVTLTSGITLDTPGVDLTLNGDGHTITQNADISLFTISSGATLTLQNIKLRGGVGKTGSGVSVTTGGTFVMQDGAEIRGFTHYNAGGVSVVSGTFRMEGGVIAGNSVTGVVSGGGGVKITDSNASFVKTGGIIYGKDAANPDDRNSARDTYGHAVLANAPKNYRDTTVGPDDDLSVIVNGHGVVDTKTGTWNQ
jgi:hypothetical protein